MLEQTTLTRPQLPRLELSEGFVKGRVSIVMPAFNEADCISKSIADAKKQFGEVCPDYEIIIVDDGSTDGTRTVAEALADRRVKVLSYQANQGKGHALKLGFHRATGEFTFMLDSDSEISPRKLIAYLTALESADIVIGSKRHPLSNVQTPVVRRFLSIGFNTLERLLIQIRASDTQVGMKGARSTALYRILPLLSVKKYAFDAELLAVATLLRFRIGELPVQIQLQAGFSIRQVFRMLIDLLGISYRLRIKKWYQKSIVSVSETYKPVLRW